MVGDKCGRHVCIRMAGLPSRAMVAQETYKYFLNVFCQCFPSPNYVWDRNDLEDDFQDFLSLSVCAAGLLA